MGTFEVKATVLSLDGSSQEETTMLVDTGATFSLMPASALQRLGVEPRLQACGERRRTVEAEYATGQACGEPGRTVETVGVGLAQMEIEGFSEYPPHPNPLPRGARG